MVANTGQKTFGLCILQYLGMKFYFNPCPAEPG